MDFVPKNKGKVLGCEAINRWMTVYYGYIGGNSFNLLHNSKDGKDDFTMYLNEDKENPYFVAEPEFVAKRKILALANS